MWGCSQEKQRKKVNCAVIMKKGKAYAAVSAKIKQFKQNIN